MTAALTLKRMIHVGCKELGLDGGTSTVATIDAAGR